MLKSLALLLGAILLSGAPALAGDDADETQAADQEQLHLESMVVVGDKLGRDIQQLPTSTSVIDSVRIEDEPIMDIADAFNRMPNVTTGASMFGSFSIRGVNNSALTSSFNQTNSLATVSVNQVPLGHMTSDWLMSSMWDVSSVEVLRGPQSTTQGPNSLIGAAFVTYKHPDFSLDGKVRGEYGQYNTWNTAFYQNIPVVDNYFSARVSGEVRRSDGAVENDFTNVDDVAKVDDRMIRAQALYQPTGSEDIKFNLTGLYKKSKTNPFPYVQSQPGVSLADRKEFSDVEGKYSADIGVLALEGDIKFNENWKLVTVTGYSDFKGDMFYDTDLTPMPIMSVNADLTEKGLNQDLRLKYDSGPARGLLGAFYSHNETTSYYVSGARQASSVLPSLEWDLGDKTTTAAIYFNGEYDFFERLTLNLGLRYNHENRESSNKSSSGAISAALDGEEQYNQLLPSASLSYKITEGISTGVKYGRGYRSGGIAVAPFAGIAKSYDEEFTNNYELFFRSKLLDDKLVINTNFYYTDWQDMQVPILAPGGIPGFDNLIVNAGQAELMGFELETSYNPLPGLNCFASLGYSHTEFKDFVANGVDYAGQALPNAPEWNFSIGANYNHSSGFFMGASYRWTDNAYTELNSSDYTEMSTRNLVDAKVGYRAENWSVYLWGSNLLDDDYEVSINDIRMWGREKQAVMSTPRMVGIGIEIYW